MRWLVGAFGERARTRISKSAPWSFAVCATRKRNVSAAANFWDSRGSVINWTVTMIFFISKIYIFVSTVIRLLTEPIIDFLLERKGCSQRHRNVTLVMSLLYFIAQMEAENRTQVKRNKIGTIALTSALYTPFERTPFTRIACLCQSSMSLAVVLSMQLTIILCSLL